MKIPNYLEIFLFVCHIIVVADSNLVSKKVEVSAILVFGDSIMDPGNNNYIKTLVKCDFAPYGRDFTGGIPTGRFSNGKIPSDFIAEELGVKELLPAYLDPNLTIEELLTGVSFASGASGYDPLTSKIASVLSLDDQLEMFKDYIKKIKAAVGEEKATAILSKSVIIVCTGSDDIANTYFITPFRRFHYDIPSYTDLMLRSASNFLHQLYALGGRRIGVLSLPAIGCVPSKRTLNGGIARSCSEAANGAAALFNSKLSSLITSLGNQYSDSKIAYFDVYNPLLALIQNPAQYGFEEAKKGCCGTGNIEVSVLCNPSSIPLSCPDADKYIFWDSYHPSTKAYKILTRQLVKDALSKLS
ncbi:GDSL esterase/lipase EXL3-like [Cucurbita maxima]|uniref:GDSL esterase/lipase EXL3-like n=1 Tax=Cucurbita maxima TaxID=3661 RepID=A0A6J1KNX3_CUCMA|nr:GDSL esterase/lipase EXL3-like [Cucurbita maxima]